MSILRDIRLLIAKNLDLPTPQRASIIEILNLLDSSLDDEGYEPTADLVNALKKLDKIILEDLDEDDVLADEPEDGVDDNEYIDLEDIEFEDEEDDDDDLD